MMDEDVEIYREFQQSPLAFIDAMWSLAPQPVKPECADVVRILIEGQQYDQIRPEYFGEFLKGQHITWQQWLVVLAVQNAVNGLGLKKISVVSGHGTGKDAILSMLMLWYLFCFMDAQIAATAPTSDLLHDILWKELNLWLGKMPDAIKGLYDWSAGYLRIKERPETWFARARTARKEAPEAIAGVHGPFVFIPVDEASGVAEEVFRTAEGSLTGENTLVLLISNGTRNLGYFYNTHHNDHLNWVCMAFDSEQSPIVDHEYIERIEKLYGRESDEFKIRVQGQFPSSEQMDEVGWIPLFTDRTIVQISDGITFIGKKRMGIDPSGEGDDKTIWVVRDRFQARVVATEITSNEKSIAKKTYDLAKDLGISPSDITVDNFGVGANVAKELLLLDHSFGVIALNWGSPAQDETTYINRRAEAHFRGRDWIIRGGAIVGDELKKDLLAVEYQNTLAGKKKIMDKPKLKQKLGRSPDRGDAFFLTFIEPEEIIDSTNGMVRAEKPLDPFAAI